MSDFASALPIAAERLEPIEMDLRQAFELHAPNMPPELAEMLSYHLGWSSGDSKQVGKRIRPILVVLACEAAGGKWRSALPAASAIELVHNFSLVHDDIQDESDTRRGRPALWTHWGVAQGINAGDALFALARLASHRLVEHGIPAAITLEAQRVIDLACLELTVGQYLDLDFERREAVSEDSYLRMVRGKTSALLAACTEVGARIAEAQPEIIAAYKDFGSHLGMAFQILDDILGIWGSPERTGKPAGDDLIRRKKTLPITYGLRRSDEFRRRWGQSEPDVSVPELTDSLDAIGARAHAQDLAEGHTAAALAALERADPSPDAAAELLALADQLLQRDL